MADEPKGELDGVKATPGGFVRRTCFYRPETWRAARRAAGLVTARTGREVSINELQRWGLHLVLKRIANDQLGPPDSYTKKHG